ncbi:MAG: cytochrome c-type biogenesis protein CcmH [Sterolibacterium sp.]|nr:cytochrome c-type biogenesis protein CcmH [Sterolibacterium sp.]
MKVNTLLGILLFWLHVFALSPLQANEAAPLADDPVVEKRLQDISEELRCLVCQNESLAGSRAELAQDLRREIRSMIEAGQTDNEIKTFLVDRYGDFVLYRPPMRASTWLLWFGPFILLIAALLGLIGHLRHRARNVTTDDATLSDEQRQAAEALLNSSIDENPPR